MMGYGERRLNKDFLEWDRFVDGQVLFFKDLYIFYMKRNPDLAEKIKTLAKDLKETRFNGQPDTKKDCAVKNTIKWGRKGL